MKSFWGRRVWIMIFVIAFVGLFALNLTPIGVFEGFKIVFQLMGDSFDAARINLEQRGFRCGIVQSSSAQPQQEALACDRIPNFSPRSEDRVYRVELVGLSNKITHVTARMCGSVSRPCPTPPAVSASGAAQVAPVKIPPASQPAPQSVVTAFAVFSSIVSAAWFFDWRHYIRFWLGRRPDYQGRWAIGFRIFFGICFLSSLQMVTRSIVMHKWTFQDGKNAAFWLFIMIVAGAAFDGIFRFSMGRPKVDTSRVL